MTALKSKRINTGIYEIKIGEHIFEIEQFNPSDWLLFYMEPSRGLTEMDGVPTYNREYIRDFWRKSDGLEWLAQHGVNWINS